MLFRGACSRDPASPRGMLNYSCMPPFRYGNCDCAPPFRYGNYGCIPPFRYWNYDCAPSTPALFCVALDPLCRARLPKSKASHAKEIFNSCALTTHPSVCCLRPPCRTRLSRNEASHAAEIRNGYALNGPPSCLSRSTTVPHAPL